MYTDDSLITFGRYRFTKLCRVPATYLIDISKYNYPDKELKAYVESNIEKISDRLEGRINTPKPIKVCKKITYASEKNAKADIKKIQKIEQENKKPVRAYECEKCGGWHLTSISYEEWNTRKMIDPIKSFNHQQLKTWQK